MKPASGLGVGGFPETSLPVWKMGRPHHHPRAAAVRRGEGRGGEGQEVGGTLPDHPLPEDQLPAPPLEGRLQPCVLPLQPPQQLQCKPLRPQSQRTQCSRDPAHPAHHLWLSRLGPPGLTRPTRGRSHLPAGQPRLQHKQAKPTKPLTTPVIPQAPHKRGSRGVGG